jgi:sugar lactone lactonase YvrE
MIDVLETPTVLPTSCAFGGADGGELFVTSQTQGLVPRDYDGDWLTHERVEAAHSDPQAGGLFVCRPGATGPPATPFAC